MRSKNIVAGEQLAQVENPDPFASPVWRSPVYRTPEPVIWLVQLIRLVGRVLWFAVTHPVLDMIAGTVLLIGTRFGTPGLVGLVLTVAAGLAGLRVWRPDWFTRFVAQPCRDRWRWWFYRRRWQAAMTLAGLAPTYRGRVLVPVLGKVRASAAVDLVTVGLVTGQTPAHLADRAENLAHAFGVTLCRVRTAGPGLAVLELVRHDTLRQPIPALPIPDTVDLAGLPVGMREDGTPWLLRLLGTHVLIAGVKEFSCDGF